MSALVFSSLTTDISITSFPSFPPFCFVVPFIRTQTYLVQGPARVTGDGKVRVEGQVRDILGGLPHVGGGLDLGQAVGHEPDAVHQEAIGVALDLEVAEEGVCPEEGKDLV